MMKKSFALTVLPTALAATMMFCACGDDSSSGASNVEYGDDSSSSVEEKSSSSSSEKVKDDSSSSKEESVKKKARAATLDDLQKNMSLGEMFGTEVFLATGTKQGLFSLWITDPVQNIDSAWIAVRSDFEGGVLKVEKGKGSFMGTNSSSADAMSKFLEKSGKLKFIVNEEDQLQVSVNGGDYVNVEKATVYTSKNWLSDANDLQGLKLSCKNGDIKQVYSFYNGRYIAEETEAESVSWSAGYYDIQRSYLLMLPVSFNNKVLSMVAAQVKSDYTINMISGDSLKCEKSALKFGEIDREKLVGQWAADGDGYDWLMVLEENGKYSMTAYYGRTLKESRSGVWDIYGDQLLIENTACLDKGDGSECATIVSGTVKKDKSGLTFKHNDKDNSPAVPTVWTAREEE